MDEVNKIQFEIPNNKKMSPFRTKQGLRGRNILSVASSIFTLEKDQKQKDFQTVSIPLFNPNNFSIDLSKLESFLKDLAELILLKDFDFSFRNDFKNKKQKNKPYISDKFQTLSLFSGGVDSFCGILIAKKQFNKLAAVFCSHSDQKKIIGIVKHLSNLVLNKYKINLYEISVPRIQTLGYSQMRGFLYFVSAAAWMDILKSKQLIITEVGPTMYQPRLTYFDSVTMTTHPYVVEYSKKVIELLLDRKVDFVLPFENMTKAEVVANCTEKEHLKETHSCISQRFGTHDGTCYGCIMRRLAFITAGVEDVNYERNPIIDASANSENLLALLRYNQMFLTNYEEMGFYQIENIEMFKKYDLFRRFALDNFAAIHKLIESGINVIEPVKNLYLETINVLGKKDIEERIDSLKKDNIQHAFEPFTTFNA